MFPAGPQPHIIPSSDSPSWKSSKDEPPEEQVLREESEPSHAEIQMSLFALMGRPYEFQDFDEAQLTLARVLSITPSGDPSTALIYEIFDNLCTSQPQRERDAENHIFSGPIPAGAMNDPEKLYGFGLAHLGQFILEGGLDDLERSIERFTEAIELTDETDPTLPKYIFGLADSLFEKFERFSDIEYLEATIQHQRRGISLLLAPEPYFLANLGFSLMRRSELMTNPADLEEAIELQERALDSTNADTEKAEFCHSYLAASLVSRFENASNPLDLDRAIELYEHTLGLDLNTKLRATTLNNIGGAHMKRYIHSVEFNDIEKAIAYQKMAIELISDGDTYKPGHLANLAVSLQHRFENLGDIADLKNAESHLRDALSLLPKRHSLRPAILNDLGRTYLLHFGSTGDPVDIRKSIDYLSTALELTPDNSLDKPKWLLNLGHAFREKFELLGGLEDIDRAINYHNEAVLATPEAHMDKADRLDHLGSAYMSRFERLEEFPDLEAAIEHYRTARSIYGVGNKKAQGLLNNLGSALCRRFDQSGHLDDIDESIAAIREAIEVSAKRSYMPILLGTLSVSLTSRYRRTNHLEDIDESIARLECAISLTTEKHTVMHSWLHWLCVTLYLRYEGTHNIEDLDKAIEYQAQAVNLTQAHHPNRPVVLLAYGDVLALRHASNEEPQGTRWKDAISAYREAALSSVGSPNQRFEAAFRWAHLLSLQNESPLEAYKVAFSLVPQIVWMGTTVSQRYKGITSISRLTTRAVSYAIAEGTYPLALEWFEEGRSIVWRQMLDLRTPMDELRSTDPSLADEIERVAQALDQAGSAKPTHSAAPRTARSLEQAAQSHHRLAEAWDELLGKARQLEGFSDFLRPKKAATLLKSARNGAVVAINVNETRCDALVIQDGGTRLDCVPLPGLSYRKVLDAQKQLMTSLSLAGVRQRSEKPVDSSKTVGLFQKFKDLKKPFMTTRKSKAVAPPEEVTSPGSSVISWFPLSRGGRRPFVEEEDIHVDELGNMLELLWEDVVHPILDCLEYLNPKSGTEIPHITWCATGPLAFLPLHAAGNYKSPKPNYRVFNCVVSSYTPTLTGLLAPPPSSNDFSGILLVGQASTPGLSALPGTEKELKSIARSTKSLRCTMLTDEFATPGTVLEAIDSHSWVHFACHASQVPHDPTSSAFYLHTGTLDLNTITQQSLGHKAFAFLSACQTATGDVDLPEEAVHLAAGMIMAGYPSAIATMWSIGDSDAPLIAEHTYAQMLAGGKPDSTKAARALHRAVGILREQVGESAFVSWVPYIHMGI